MKPYKLKHLPTGLYYQPYTYRGSNLSKKGKIYQGNTHGLSSTIKRHKMMPDDEYYKCFYVFVHKNCSIYREFQHAFNWQECGYSCNTLKAETKLSDSVIEEII